MRTKEYSTKDVILMLGKIQNAAEDDVCDQICLAYGHAVFHGFQLLAKYGRVDVDAIYPLVRPGGLHEEVSRIRSLLETEIRNMLEWFSFLREMHAFQPASALYAIDLGRTYAVAYAALIEQIRALGAVIQEELDPATEVFRKMHKHDPVDMCPMLDSDMDLNSGQVVSPVTIRIFPSQHDQLIAQNIRQFMHPESSRDQALQYGSMSWSFSRREATMSNSPLLT